jgi:hypothetical protein
MTFVDIPTLNGGQVHVMLIPGEVARESGMMSPTNPI